MELPLAHATPFKTNSVTKKKQSVHLGAIVLVVFPYPSEQYESVTWDYDIPNMMGKPPTRYLYICIILYTHIYIIYSISKEQKKKHIHTFGAFHVGSNTALRPWYQCKRYHIWIPSTLLLKKVKSAAITWVWHALSKNKGFPKIQSQTDEYGNSQTHMAIMANIHNYSNWKLFLSQANIAIWDLIQLK